MKPLTFRNLVQRFFDGLVPYIGRIASNGYVVTYLQD